MMEPEKRITEFFNEYQHRFNDALQGKPNSDFMAGAFAEHFIEAHPAGVICGKNDAAFKAKISEGNEFYHSIGTQSMTILSNRIAEIYPGYFMAKVTWDSRYEKDGNSIRIVFDVVYFIQWRDGRPKIFAYITGDEQKVLRENGLVPKE